MTLIIDAVDFVFTLMIMAIFARAIVSWLPIDRYHPAIQFLDSITEPIIAPFRRFIPPIGMLDLSSLVALIAIQILQSVVHNILVGMLYR